MVEPIFSELLISRAEPSFSKKIFELFRAGKISLNAVKISQNTTQNAKFIVFSGYISRDFVEPYFPRFELLSSFPKFSSFEPAQKASSRAELLARARYNPTHRDIYEQKLE